MDVNLLSAAGPYPDLDASLAMLIANPTTRANPYPTYKMLRDKAPVYKPSMGGLVITTYDECKSVLVDNRLGKGSNLDTSRRDRQIELLDLSDEELLEISATFENRANLLFLDPPDHTRLRNLVSRAFTPKKVELLRDHVRLITRNLLLSLPPEFDLMEAVAWKLPMTVIGELVGIPEEDREDFRPLVRRGIRLLEPTISKSEFLDSVDAARGMQEYISGIVQKRKDDPKDDLITHLIQVRDGTDKLTDNELISTVQLLFAAGFETTTNLIGNGTVAFLKNPSQMELIRNNPSLIVSAVEEILRYDSPVQFDARTALSDIELFGTFLEQGEMVMTILGAANHDPSHFSDPENFDITRDEGPPLSFAAGIHYCLGASLARMEGQVFFSELFNIYKSIELNDDPPVRDSLTLRGYHTISLSTTPF